MGGSGLAALRPAAHRLFRRDREGRDPDPTSESPGRRRFPALSGAFFLPGRPGSWIHSSGAAPSVQARPRGGQGAAGSTDASRGRRSRTPGCLLPREGRTSLWPAAREIVPVRLDSRGHPLGVNSSPEHTREIQAPGPLGTLGATPPARRTGALYTSGEGAQRQEDREKPTKEGPYEGALHLQSNQPSHGKTRLRAPLVLPHPGPATLFRASPSSMAECSFSKALALWLSDSLTFSLSGLPRSTLRSVSSPGLSVCLSVCPSVRPSVCLFVTGSRSVCRPG